MSCKVIIIKAHWKDEPENVFEKDCIIGQWDGISNDDYIFYFFDNDKEVIGDHGDFVVLSYKEII